MFTFRFPTKTLVIAAALICFSAGLTNAAPIVIKFSHVVAENTPKGLMATKFKQLVEERLPGKVVVEVYPNSQLYGDDNVLEAMLLGDVQLAAPALSKFENYTKAYQVFDMPFLFKDIQAVDCFQNSPQGKVMLDALKKFGLNGLGYLHNGLKQLSASNALRVPEDAKGRKFRIMASDVLAAQFEALNAIPLKKPFSEVFILLQTKAIDGQENTWSNIYSQKYYEIQPYITESNHGVLDYLVVSSDAFWNGLPDDVKPIVDQSLQESIAYGNQVALDKDKEDRQKIVESGRTEIIQLTPEQRQMWVDAMKPVWAKFEEGIGKENIEAALGCNK